MSSQKHADIFYKIVSSHYISIKILFSYNDPIKKHSRVKVSSSDHVNLNDVDYIC